MKYKHT